MNGLAIGGTAVRAAGTDMKFGSDLLGAWGQYYAAKLSARLQKAGAKQLDAQADNYNREAVSYLDDAGKEQKAGEWDAVNRYLQLGSDIGHIYAGAAGANIEASSDVVARSASAARLMANRDVQAINRNAAERAASSVSGYTSARINAIQSAAQADIQRINARYAKKAAKFTLFGNVLSAVGNWASGHGANAQSLFGAG